MAANVTDRLWDMADLVAVVDRFDDAQPRKKAGRKPKAATEPAPSPLPAWLGREGTDITLLGRG